MSSFDVSKEIPWIAPLKSGFQCGAPSPVKDGIMTTSEFLFADFANFTEIELPFRKKSSSNNTIAGVGIGFRYGMRNLGGLPLIFTFGEGINVSQASREAHRREFMLVVAAGF